MKTILSTIAVIGSFNLSAQNSANLEINDVRALINNYNSMHWDMFGGGNAMTNLQMVCISLNLE